MQMPMRFVYFVLFFAILTLTACGRISLGYRHAPLLASLWVDEVFDLPGAQSDAVRAAFDATWDWHVEAPRRALVALMREAADRLDRPVDEADVGWVLDALDRQTGALERVFATRLVSRWPAMSAEEVAGVAQHLAERRTKLSAELAEAEPEQRALEQTEKLVDELEGWFGEVTDAQQIYIVRHEAMRLDRHIWLRERERRHGELVDILARNDLAALKDWIAHWREQRPTDVVAETQRRDRIYRRFWTGLIHMAEPAQIAHAQHRLRAWAEDLAAVDLPGQLAAPQDDACATC